MISHEHKCIFVHISRTGGSSIERTIFEKDWWFIDPATKHLTASKTKEIYKDYWDSYFKFSFVRNPWDRMISCYSHKGYKKFFGTSLIDFLNNTKIPRHEPQFLEYTDILDTDLDFVGKFENLEEDFKYIKNKIGIKNELKHFGKTKRTKYQDYYCDKSIRLVEEMYKKSIVKYEYKF